ncbi:MAG TPA: hypothetical protein VMG55_05655 [Stellaceae bacterium]|nr:hypothetical protein [Stellaceae bacterium]
MQPLRAAALIVGFILCSTLARAQSSGGDVFSTNTNDGGKPLTGSAQDYACFDESYRQAKNALQAWQISDAPNWKDPPDCQKGGETSGGDLGSCWGPLHSAQSLIEQASQLFKTARRTPDPQSESITKQANDLLKQAASLIQQAWGCYQPIYRAHTQRQPSPSQTPPRGPVASNTPPQQGQQPPQRPPQNSHGSNPQNNQAQPPGDCQQQLKSTGNEALDTMVGMGQQADRMLTAFGQTIGSAAAQVMNPQAFAQQQIKNVQLLMGMLAQDNETFKKQVWQGMLDTLEHAKQDGAGTLGTLAAQRVLGGAVSAAGGAVVRTACKAVPRVKKALDRAKALKKIKADQPTKPVGTQGTCATVNPSGLRFGCLPRSIAADMKEDTGFANWTADNFKNWPGDRPPTVQEMKDLLKSLYGNRRFRTLSEAENLAHADGGFVRITPDELKRKLAEAGDGSRALVITQSKFNPTSSHAFNAGHQGGFNVFDAEGAEGGLNYTQRIFDPYEHGEAMDMWYYRTGGPDMLQ